MECPHCGYDEYKDPEKKEFGKFFESEVRLERKSERFFNTVFEKTSLYACPKCRKAFVENY